jgi:hypothetical protein
VALTRGRPATGLVELPQAPREHVVLDVEDRVRLWVEEVDEKLREPHVGMRMPDDTDLFEKLIDPCDVARSPSQELEIGHVVRVSHVEHIMTSMCSQRNPNFRPGAGNPSVLFNMGSRVFLNRISPKIYWCVLWACLRAAGAARQAPQAVEGLARSEACARFAGF